MYMFYSKQLTAYFIIYSTEWRGAALEEVAEFCSIRKVGLGENTGSKPQQGKYFFFFPLYISKIRCQSITFSALYIYAKRISNLAPTLTFWSCRRKLLQLSSLTPARAAVPEQNTPLLKVLRKLQSSYTESSHSHTAFLLVEWPHVAQTRTGLLQCRLKARFSQQEAFHPDR